MNPIKLITSIFFCIIFTITMIGGCISVPEPPLSNCIWENSKINCFYFELNYPHNINSNMPLPYIFSFAHFFQIGNDRAIDAKLNILVSSDNCIGCTNNTFSLNQESYYSYMIDDYCINYVPFINNIEPKYLTIDITFKFDDVYDLSSGQYGNIIWYKKSSGYEEGFVFNTSTNTFNITNLTLLGKFTPREFRIVPVYHCGRYIESF